MRAKPSICRTPRVTPARPPPEISNGRARGSVRESASASGRTSVIRMMADRLPIPERNPRTQTTPAKRSACAVRSCCSLARIAARAPPKTTRLASRHRFSHKPTRVPADRASHGRRPQQIPAARTAPQATALLRTARSDRCSAGLGRSPEISRPAGAQAGVEQTGGRRRIVANT